MSRQGGTKIVDHDDSNAIIQFNDDGSFTITPLEGANTPCKPPQAWVQHGNAQGSADTNTASKEGSLSPQDDQDDTLSLKK